MLADDTVRLVTLTGPGGIGKSRLAIAVANALSDRFADGATFVDLSPVRDPDLVPNAIAQALGVRDTGDAPIVDKLVDGTARAPHPAGARQLRAGDRTPHRRWSRLLVRGARADAARDEPRAAAGQRRAQLRGRSARPPGPVAAPGARRGRREPGGRALHRARARGQARLRGRTGQRRGGRADLRSARRGAARSRTGGGAHPGALARRRCSNASTAGSPCSSAAPATCPQRQQTLRNTIEWSAELLDDEQRRMLARLGVFRGGFSLEAAEAVAVDSPDVDALDRAQRAGRQQPGQPAGPPHLDAASSCWPTVREYALEQLDHERAGAACAKRLARVLPRARRPGRIRTRGARQRELVQRLTDERDNLRAVERYLLDTRALRPGRAPRLGALRLLVGRRPPRRGARLDGRDPGFGDRARRRDPRDRRSTSRRRSGSGRTRTAWSPRGSPRARTSSTAPTTRVEKGSPLISLGVALLARQKPEPEQAAEAFETATAPVPRERGRLGRVAGAGHARSFRARAGQRPGALDRFEESLDADPRPS